MHRPRSPPSDRTFALQVVYLNTQVTVPEKQTSLGGVMTYLGAGLALSASAARLVPDADTAPFFSGVPAAVQGRQPGSTAAVGTQPF